MLSLQQLIDSFFTKKGWGPKLCISRVILHFTRVFCLEPINEGLEPVELELGTTVS